MGRQKDNNPPRVFDADPDNGIIRRSEGGQRILALGSVGWATLEHELTSTFVTGAAVILQRMGYSYGRHLGRVAKSRGHTQEDAVQAFELFSVEGGWGRPSLNGGDLASGQAALVMKDCFFCLHFKDSESPVCDMLVGLVGGFFDEILGVTHRVTEDRCIAKGDRTCQIVLERLS